MQFPYCISCSTGIPRVIKSDGTLVRDFKNDFGYVLLSEISQQGNRLAFTKLNNVVIYALDQEFYPILMDSVSSLFPVRSITWSPDEEKYLMLKYGDPTQIELDVYELSTRTVIPIFEFSEPDMYLELHSPGWSADGSQVSFIANKILYIGDAKGVGLQPVSVENQPVLNAAWSNTAHELVYVRHSSDTTKIEMIIYDPISQTSTPLWETKTLEKNLGSYNWHLEWSKDGSSIAFQGTDGEHVGLFIINRDGTDLRQILDGHLLGFDWHED